MATSLADYKIISDSGFTLTPGEDRSYDFTVNTDIVRFSSDYHRYSQRPILAYFADPSGDAENLQVIIEINPGITSATVSDVSSYRYSGGTGRAHFEVLRHGNLQPDRTNELRFTCDSGEGSIKVSDIIIWYQRLI